MRLSVSHGSPVTHIQVLDLDDTDNSFGVTHLAYLYCSPCRCRLLSFAMCLVLPGSDYYESSVTLGLSPLRPSRVPVT